VRTDGKQGQQSRKRIARNRGIEFGFFHQAEFHDSLTREIGGGDHLGLALDGLIVVGRGEIGRRLLWPREITLLVLQQNFGEGGVSRTYQRDES